MEGSGTWFYVVTIIIQMVTIGITAQQRLGHPGILWAVVVLLANYGLSEFFSTSNNEELDTYMRCLEFAQSGINCDHLRPFSLKEPELHMVAEAIVNFLIVTVGMLGVIFSWPRRSRNSE